MNKREKKNVLAGLIVLAFVGVLVISFDKYDNVPESVPTVAKEWKGNSELTGSVEDYFEKVQLIPTSQFYTEPFAASKNGIKDSLANYFTENIN